MYLKRAADVQNLSIFTKFRMYITACVFIIARAIAATEAGVPTIITREQWGALPPKEPAEDLSENPPPFVVIHHSATVGCNDRTSCEARVRSFQKYHMDTNKWADIGYNFLVGEDGNIYEGRGWGKKGAHATIYNGKSMGICVIGDFSNHTPNAATIQATKDLISYGVSLGKIKQDYGLIGHRQVKATTCPGDSFYSLIQSWPNWKNI